MLHLRLRALDELKLKVPPQAEIVEDITQIYGEDTFGDKQLQDRLPPTAYKEFKKALGTGEPLSPAVADQIASAMKEWAIRREQLTLLTGSSHGLA